LLLLSNSFQFGKGFLDHAESEIRTFLGPIRKVAFVPYAAHDLDAYEATARDRFQSMGYELFSIHRDSKSGIDRAEAFFIGGGNTFRLLYRLYERSVFNPIKHAVDGGVPFIGSSAGSIVAGPTLKTTKDMPVLEPESFNCFGFVDFQISPHYLDPDLNSTHMGETQEERIGHFLEENDARVLGLREGSMLRIEDKSTTLIGLTSARLFQRDTPPFECSPGPVDWPPRAAATMRGR
jgi:dipeptidase E